MSGSWWEVFGSGGRAMPDPRRPVITLATDFGHLDPYVGVMKGVILGIVPDAVLVDITHELPSHDLLEAAWLVDTYYRYFPPRTVHVVVVDPGVGSPRRPLLVVTDRYYFVGPDNGVLTAVLRQGSPQVIHVTASHYFLPQLSATFHGRDVFAPVAAWLAHGTQIHHFGEPVTDYRLLDWPTPRLVGDLILEGQVLHLDRFGNAITNITQADLDRLLGKRDNPRFKIVAKGHEIHGLKAYYAQAAPEELAAILGSAGTLELFVYMGSAAERFGLQRGDPVGVVLMA